MKKVVLFVAGLLASVQLNAGVSVVPQNEFAKINTADIPYRYNYTLKKCEAMDFQLRVQTVDMIRGKNSSVDEKFVNEAGTTWIVSFLLDGKEYEAALMSTFGECRFYEDVVIKKLDVKDTQYKNLK